MRRPLWIGEVLPAAVLVHSPKDSPHGLWEFSLPELQDDPRLKAWRREVVVIQEIRRAGWHAYWRPGNRHTWAESVWPGEVRSIPAIIRHAPAPMRPVLRDIRAKVKGRTRAGFGWPDIALWDATGQLMNFIEVKGPLEQLRSTQVRWVEHALACGVDRNDIAIVRLDAPRGSRRARLPAARSL